MLEIVVPETELYDEKNEEFISIKEHTLQLEHSLISISKWESKWRKPFMEKKPPKTPEQFLDYIKCMTINRNVNPLVYNSLTQKNLEDITNYIEKSQSATWFNDIDSDRSREIITSEIVYYWMIKANIPFECARWHFSRLITLIRIFSIKEGPQKKMSKSEILARNRALNEQRRAELNSKG